MEYTENTQYILGLCGLHISNSIHVLEADPVAKSGFGLQGKALKVIFFRILSSNLEFWSGA